MESSGWSSLPWDILVEILESLDILDLIRSKAVCRQWKSSPTRKHSTPWLLCTDYTVGTSVRRSKKDYNVENKFENMCLVKKRIPGLVGHKMVGSSDNGWLMHVGKSNVLEGINLINKRRFECPPYSTMWKTLRVERDDHNSKRIVGYHLINSKSGFRFFCKNKSSMGGYFKALTYSCATRNVTVVIDKRSRLLAFSVQGGKHWRVLFTGEIEDFQDLLFSNGLFHAVNSNGQVVSCDLSAPSSPKVKLILARNFHYPPMKYHPNVSRCFLFQLAGDLCYLYHHRSVSNVVNDYGEFLGYTGMVKLRIAKLVRLKDKGGDDKDDGDDEFEWEEIRSLGDHALFLGTYNSTCLSTTQNYHDHHPRIQRNHVYFDMRVGFHRPTGDKISHEIWREFDLRGGNQREYILGKDPLSLLKMPRATWVMPFNV